MRRLGFVILGALGASIGLSLASSTAAAADVWCSGDVVVMVDARVRTGIPDDRLVVDLPAVAPGIYQVVSLSSDSSDNRARIDQPNEQFTVEIAGIVLGPTTDLEDLVAAAEVFSDLGEVTLSVDAIAATITHVGGAGAGSVNADCLGLTLVESAGDFLEIGADLDCAAAAPAVTLALDNGGRLDTPVAARSGGDEQWSGLVLAGEALMVLVAAPDDGAVELYVADNDPLVVDVGVCDGAGLDQPDPDPRPDPPTEPDPDSPDDPSRPGPAVSFLLEANPDCASGVVHVSALNSGDITESVDIVQLRGSVQSGITVGPNEVALVEFPLLAQFENGVADFSVLHDQLGVIAVASAPIDCTSGPRAVATPVLDCPTMELGVTVTNVGDERGSWTVVRSRAASIELQLEAGQSATVDFAINAGDEGSLIELFVLDASGAEVMRRMVTIDCTSAPEWLLKEVVVDCGSGFVRVVVDNLGDAAGMVTVTVADLASQPAEAAANESVAIEIASAELGDGRFTYAVHSDSGSVGRGEIERDCVMPSASAIVECGGVDVELANEGSGSARFRLELAGGNGAALLTRYFEVDSGRQAVEIERAIEPDFRVTVFEATEAQALAVATLDRPCSDGEIVVLGSSCMDGIAVFELADPSDDTIAIVFDYATTLADVNVDGSVTVVSADAGDSTAADLHIGDSALARASVECPGGRSGSAFSAAWAVLVAGLMLTAVGAWWNGKPAIFTAGG